MYLLGGSCSSGIPNMGRACKLHTERPKPRIKPRISCLTIFPKLITNVTILLVEPWILWAGELFFFFFLLLPWCQCLYIHKFSLVTVLYLTLNGFGTMKPHSLQRAFEHEYWYNLHIGELNPLDPVGNAMVQWNHSKSFPFFHSFSSFLCYCRHPADWSL